MWLKPFQLLCCLFLIQTLQADFNPVTGDPVPVKKPVTEEGRVFIINASVKNMDDFRKLVKQALVLKPYGKVKVNISTLADKGFYEIPEKGSPWHEYASANPTPYKFFPDPKLAPFIPAEFVKKNRQLLLDKAKVLRENGLEAAFIGYEPNFLPAAFFDAYPEMLGPRVDHPRRSTQKAFAPCISVRETQVMYANMMAELLKNAPEITTFAFKTNDAGAGMCWADWLYTGPNGPSHCKHISIGEQANQLLSSFQEGAKKAGHELSIYLDEGSSNFSEAEKKDIQSHLPANCYYESTEGRDIDVTGGMLSGYYPVQGLINPLAWISSARGFSKGSNKTVFINFRAAYDRGMERTDVTEMIFDIIQRELKDPGNGGTLSAQQELQQLCEVWGGKSAAALFNAFNTLTEAITYKSNSFARMHSLYWGVTTRLMNRPLVIAPQRLTDKEEAYFLPYVFNVSKEEARMDYTDVHGVHSTVPDGVVENYVNRIKRAASQFESLDASAPRKEFFRRMALALRMHASIIRSCGNFAAAQAIRDRDSTLVNGPIHRPDKTPVWAGHPDFIPFNNIMRDELDNTQEMIRLLEKGGKDLLVYASDPAYEDRFILGPDLLNQLKKKRKIMLDHWQDVEDYLASPFK